jgi:hypothetical protein
MNPIFEAEKALIASGMQIVGTMYDDMFQPTKITFHHRKRSKSKNEKANIETTHVGGVTAEHVGEWWKKSSRCFMKMKRAMVSR